MLTSFIAEPESPVFVEENYTKVLIWKLVDCDWQVRVVTDSFQLHPEPLIPLPIKINIDYNVTETCQDDHQVVHFSIVFNENVLSKSIEYVACKIFRNNAPTQIIDSRVNFTNNIPISSTFNTETTTSMTTIESRSSSCTGAAIATMTGSAFNLSVHLITIILGLIVANLLFSCDFWEYVM
jgi:hypothetical protein